MFPSLSNPSSSPALPPKPGHSTTRLGNAASANAGLGWLLLPGSNMSPRHSQSHPAPYSLPYWHPLFPSSNKPFQLGCSLWTLFLHGPRCSKQKHSKQKHSWAIRMPVSNCVVSKPYCLVAIVYKLIRIFIGWSVHDKKRWPEVKEICFEYKPNTTLNHGIFLFLLLHSAQACEDLSYPNIFIAAEFCRSATSWLKKLHCIFI